MQALTHVNPHSLLFALHGSIILLSGLASGFSFARSITRSSNEVAWRVVHSGACAAGTMLLAIAVPVQWILLPDVLATLLVWSLLAGTYLLVAGMFVAAIWKTRGIPGGGAWLNRLVHSLYGIGAVLSLAGCTLLVTGLLRACRLIE